jgi:hypothetical protein
MITPDGKDPITGYDQQGKLYLPGVHQGEVCKPVVPETAAAAILL